MTDDDRRTRLTEMSRELTDRGKLIEAGFLGLQLAAIPPDAPVIQVQEMRHAFFAGAHHLFASIMTILDPGAEPTEADMRRMNLIDAELKEFIADFESRLAARPPAQFAAPPAPAPALGDAPIEDKYWRMMNSIAGILDEAFNGSAKGQDRTTGFVLLVFPFEGHEGRCNYISNGADRHDIVTLFKEQIKRFEGQPEVERLREALRPFAELGDKASGNGKYTLVKVEWLRKARAALAASPEPSVGGKSVEST